MRKKNSMKKKITEMFLFCPVYRVKPVLRGHLWDKEKWSFKTGDLLKEVQIIWYFLWHDKKNVTF